MSTGLKKVTDAQKTHKNPELRGSSVVTEAALNKNKKAAAPAKKAAAPAKQPPKLQLVGKKWSCVSFTFLMKIRFFGIQVIRGAFLVCHNVCLTDFP